MTFSLSNSKRKVGVKKTKKFFILPRIHRNKLYWLGTYEVTTGWNGVSRQIISIH